MFDAGLKSFTEPQAPVLVHLGADKTAQMLLVRIDAQQGGN